MSHRDHLKYNDYSTETYLNQEGWRMKRGTIVMALVIALMSSAGYGDSVDNSSPSPGKDKSAPAGGTSYFEGVWAGEWELGGLSMPGSLRQDVTITIDKRNKKGFHKTTYSWGSVTSGLGGGIAPGSLVSYGKEQDGVFVFGWKGREGTKFTVKLEKQDDNDVKGRLEREGTSTALQRPYYDGKLKRK